MKTRRAVSPIVHPRHRPVATLAAMFVLVLAVACSSSGPSHGEKIDCHGVERTVLDCKSEFSYEGLEGSAGIDVANWFGVNADLAETALREVDQHVETYAAMHTRLCRDYNACIVDPEEYRRESEKIRARLTEVPTLLEALKKATSSEERMAILDRLYRGVVPESERSPDLEFHLSVNARLPDGKQTIVAPGQSLPAGSHLHFTVRSSRDAYLYMFQVQPSGELSVLYPEPRIGTHNPLPGKRAKRIPDSDQSFELTGEPGVERVYFVVSPEPVAAVESSLEKARTDEGINVADDPLLASIASVEPRYQADNEGCTRTLELTGAPASEGDGCKRPRALQLSESPPAGVGTNAGGSADAPQTSIAVRNRPSDDLIVEVFELEHVAR